MILLLSPAKALDFSAPVPDVAHSLPRLIDEAPALIECLRAYPPAGIASLMGLSDKLAALNFARYADWSPAEAPGPAARQALFAFDGDVYDGLGGRSLDPAAIDHAQRHLRILSGLYGLLRPLDLIRPYRLEMGTRLPNPRGKDLYAWWGARIGDLLAADLAADGDGVLVNLASEEYFKAVRPSRPLARVVQPVFEDWHDGRWRVISFHAKRARGMMARHAIDRRLTGIDGLREFSGGGYAFAPEASDDRVWVFRRRAG